MSMLVASETGESIESVLWQMQAVTAMKLVAMSYSIKTGKQVMSHKDKAMLRRQDEVVRSIQNVK